MPRVKPPKRLITAFIVSCCQLIELSISIHQLATGVEDMENGLMKLMAGFTGVCFEPQWRFN